MIRPFAVGTVLAGALLVASATPASAASTHVSPTASVTTVAKALNCKHAKVQKADKDDPVPPSHEIFCTASFGSLDIASWSSQAKMKKELALESAILEVYFPGTKFYALLGKTWAISDNDSNDMSTPAKAKKESAYSKKIATKLHGLIGGTITAVGG